MGIAELIISTFFLFGIMVLAGERSGSHLVYGLKFLFNLFYSFLELTKLFILHNIAYICYICTNVNTFFVKSRNNCEVCVMGEMIELGFGGFSTVSMVVWVLDYPGLEEYEELFLKD